MNKYVLILGLVCVVSAYLIGYNDSPIIERQIEINRTEIIREYIQNVSEKPCFKYQMINITRNVNNYTIINLTYDLSAAQLKSLKNLKPDKCHTIGCSEGYFKCKYDAFDIFNLKHPEFSEKPSSGGFSDYLINESIPIRYDGLGRYIELNTSFWELYRVGYDVKPFNFSKILQNKTITGNNTLLIREMNKTQHMIYVRVNRTDTLLIREV